MDADALEAHVDAATQLFRERRRQLDRPWSSADSMARLERRLRAHIAAVAGMGAQAPPPQKRDPAKIHWMVRLLAEPATALGPLVEALAGDDEAAAGAGDALFLLPAGDERTLERLETGGDSRAWRWLLHSRGAAGVGISPGRLNAALAADDEDVQRAALQAAANDPQRPPDFFRPWYADGAGVAHRATIAALHAGLLRNDPDARRALDTALERAETEADRLRALRLMALAGGPAHRETLVQYAERDPIGGIPLLALHGDPGLLEPLIDCLQRPESAEAAAAAWWRMTGTALPQVARLQAVGGESAARGTVPDAEWAAGWWRTHGARVKQYPRLLFGEALGPRSLAPACNRFAGIASHDLIAQAQMEHGPGLHVDADQWITLRRRRLAAAGLTGEPELPADAAEADPWRHGHYA